MARQVNFRFAARVVAHLGSELISSDEIAVYELIKNGFDAKSPIVSVDIHYGIGINTVQQLQQHVRDQFARRKSPEAIREFVERSLLEHKNIDTLPIALVPRIPTVGSWADRLRTARTLDDFVTSVGALNSITISDSGHGMTEDALIEHFLTIGATHRYLQHQQLSGSKDSRSKDTPPAGEKGIGRLSSMRLGNDLRVYTWTKQGQNEHLLAIDWRRFSAESHDPANAIPATLTTLPRSQPAASSGTVLVITDLRSVWSEEKIQQDIAGKCLSRFVDPFQQDRRRRVKISWNGKGFDIPLLSRAFLEAAPNGMRGNVRIDKDGRFEVHVEYWFTDADSGHRDEYSRTYTSADFDRITDSAVATVGPFDFALYHFNRRRLSAIPGVASRQEFKEWLDSWCGGLYLYRDGLRVMPYGQMPHDDWLGLDDMALRGRGFRVNRIQIVGYVRVSRRDNPSLQDQTNREGLIDNPTSQTFQGVLRRVVRELFVAELDGHSKRDARESVDLTTRAVESQTLVQDVAERLLDAVKSKDSRALSVARAEFEATVRSVAQLSEDVEKAITSRELQKTEMLELAATGLAAESLAHDLEASLEDSMKEVTIASGGPQAPPALRAILQHLQAVFKALLVQLSAIKPGPAKRRRRRTDVDVRKVIEQVADIYRPRIGRENIVFSVRARPQNESIRVKVVEGHLRQIFDNLFRNSIYWLIDSRKRFPDAPASTIDITVDLRAKCVWFADSGVGISRDDTEWVFEAFNTHREGGHGLGLYIAKELGEFNGIKITVDKEHRNHWNRHGRFILDFSGCQPVS